MYSVVKSSQVKSQRGGGFGGQLEYTRVGMRHLLRNFTFYTSRRASCPSWATRRRHRRRLSWIEGETLVCTHGNAESRYEAQTSKRTSAKAAEELEKNYK
jgi:hypothetical protein